MSNVCPYYIKEDFEYASQGRISSRNNSVRDLIILFEKLHGTEKSVIYWSGTNVQVQWRGTLVKILSSMM